LSKVWTQGQRKCHSWESIKKFHILYSLRNILSQINWHRYRHFHIFMAVHL
jgi:hypothetical protein